MSNMAFTANIQRIFNDLTFTSEFKFRASIVIKKGTYKILTTDEETIINIEDEYEYRFNNYKEKIEVFRNRIDVYTSSNTYFYKNTRLCDIKIYKPTQGFILNKHVVKLYPHNSFNLNKTIIIPFKITQGIQLCFVFDIEDKRETYANALNQMVNQQTIPSELIEKIAFDLGMIKPTKDDTYNKSQFPFNFTSKYTQTMPECFIKEQLIELYKMGVLKIAYQDLYTSSMNILTDEAYDYVFPNGQPNNIKNRFPSKEKMHEYIDTHLEHFLKN